MFPVNIVLALLPVTQILHCAFLRQYGAQTSMFVLWAYSIQMLCSCIMTNIISPS